MTHEFIDIDLTRLNHQQVENYFPVGLQVYKNAKQDQYGTILGLWGAHETTDRYTVTVHKVCNEDPDAIFEWSIAEIIALK